MSIPDYTLIDRTALSEGNLSHGVETITPQEVRKVLLAGRVANEYGFLVRSSEAIG
jgi:hypothetical protein